MKKTLFLFLIIFFALIANAETTYTTNYEITILEGTITTSPFTHIIMIDWNYTIPLGDPIECDFESPDKNYGIFLGLESAEPYALTTDNLIQSFGPTTSTPECNLKPDHLECTAKTTYFFTLLTYPTITEANYSIPTNIRGKCGKTEPEETYPINISYDYEFYLNKNQVTQIPDINITTRWGKTNGTQDAVIDVNAQDPQNKDIIDYSFIYPADCVKNEETINGLYTPFLKTTFDLLCENEGITPLIFTATNEDGKTANKAFFTYFSDNEDEVEFFHDYDELIGLPNTSQDTLNSVYGMEEHYDYRLSSITTKTLTVIKDTGNGFAQNSMYLTENTASTPFTSIQNPVCPAITNYHQTFEFIGEDFKIISNETSLLCEPGNHEIRFSVNGTSSNGSPFGLTQDFNFIVLDINFNILNMTKTSLGIGSLYGIVYGENGKIDLNVIIDNYSPEFIEITDVNLYYKPYLSSPWHSDSVSSICTFEQKQIIQETETQWKINYYLECPDYHLFYPIVYLNGYPTINFPGPLIFWVTPLPDKFKMDSTIIENLFDSVWNPETEEYCNPKTGACTETGTSSGESEGGGLISLPQETINITKGDLLRFHSTTTNVSYQMLTEKVDLVITDSQKNIVAELTETKDTLAQTKAEFSTLFYDTDFLRESQLYTVTSTVYWAPERGFQELDSKPLNNTKTTYFYVLSNQGLIENLPETNFTSIVFALIFVLIILRKK